MLINKLSISDFNSLLQKENAVMIYFYNDACQPCVALRPKISSLVEQEFEKMKLLFVEMKNNQKLSGHLGIFASPTIITYFHGKEYGRYSKYISVDELVGNIKRIYQLAID